MCEFCQVRVSIWFVRESVTGRHTAGLDRDLQYLLCSSLAALIGLQLVSVATTLIIIIKSAYAYPTHYSLLCSCVAVALSFSILQTVSSGCTCILVWCANAVVSLPMHTVTRRQVTVVFNQHICQHCHIAYVCKGCWCALRKRHIPDNLLKWPSKPLYSMCPPTKARSRDTLGFKKTPHVRY